ncbi:hypothetical protein B5F40_10835 [Gordonibacter sp. An230]|uniref:DUF7601 domain-containing protein n=1 Tax=Gordonibacter sp. An230 TaxID=1965592 RepID=UPI000B3868F0|nr:FctA domain-containing protein [Gordonibacter sp. An230]OUO89482.1 hypothetical protein B5F40_10835 [Gordonibacter sp. An230]
MRTSLPKTLRIACACLLAATLFPISALAGPANEERNANDGARTSQPITKVTDPSTANSWMDVFDLQDAAGELVYSTEEAGRLWVDKSVYASAADAEAAGIAAGELEHPDQDFLVSLSAMSSASTVRPEQENPHDTVFVVSLNSTLDSLAYDGKTHAEHLADALNGAIGRLMEEESVNGKNRVAVIGYNLHTTVMLPLDSYAPDAEGRYVKFARNLPDGGNGLVIAASPETPGVETAEGRFASYSYPQLALHEAGNLLVEAAQSANGTPRAPDLVLMGVGAAPAANADIANPPAFTGDEPEANGFLGAFPSDDHVVGFGSDVALAQLLTMQSEAARVNDAYRSSGQDLSLYTVGFRTSGISDYVLQPASVQKSMTVEDTAGGTTVNLRENIEEARALYAEAAEQGEPNVTLPLYGAGLGGLRMLNVDFPAPVRGLVSVRDDFQFTAADRSFSALDAAALDGAFDAAVDAILRIEYHSPVNENAAAPDDPADRFNMEDDLGAFMNVKRVRGIQFAGRLLDGSKAAQAIASAFADPWDLEAADQLSLVLRFLQLRYGIDWWSAYYLLSEALGEGQVAWSASDGYSNFAAYYVNADHQLVAGEGNPYRFAGNAEVAAAKTGRWQTEQSVDAATRQRIEAARAAGATAVCQTYFYIGNLENQYTGSDVPLYDFMVMVETDLDDGGQRVLLSIPPDSIPAREAYVTERTDGTAEMTLEGDALDTYPLRLVYEVGPRGDVAKLADRLAAGEEVSVDELHAVLGDDAPTDAFGNFLLYAGAFQKGGAEGIVAESTMNSLANAANSYYTFTKDAPLFQLKPGEVAPSDGHPAESQLEPLTSSPQTGETYYFLDTYYTASGLSSAAGAPATAVRAFDPYEVAFSGDEIARHFHADAQGNYFVLAGTPKFSASTVLADYAKHPNATATAPYVKTISVSEYQAADRTLLSARLGNNGVLTLSPAQKAGSLTVSKTLAAGGASSQITAADRAQEFTFRITLADKAGSPLSGTVAAKGEGGAESGILSLDEHGAVQLSLADGQSLTLTDLPEGTRFSVEEQDAAAHGFKPSFVVRTEADGEDEALSDGATDDGARAGDIAGGTITADQRTETAFTNTKQAGALTLSKRVEGNGADPSRTFAFAVRLADAEGAPVSGEFPYTQSLGGSAEGTYDGIAMADENGDLVLEGGAPMFLASDQSITVSGLPVGTAYVAWETDADGYETTVRKATDGGAAEESDGSGRIEEAEQADTLTFTNARWLYGTLNLSKQVSGTQADAGKTFDFTVTLEDGTGEPLSGTVDYTVTDADGTVVPGQTPLDPQGRFTVGLKGGQTLIADKLLQGTRYVIEEADYASDHYIVKRENAEGVIGPEPALARFTNVKQPGALGIAKLVGGNAGDKQASYSFAVDVEDLFAHSAPEETERAFDAVRYLPDGSTVSERVTFARTSTMGGAPDADDETAGAADGPGAASGTAGTAEVTLRHNEGLLIEGLDSDSAFTVTEIGAEDLIADGYTIYSGSDQSGSLQEGYVHEGALASEAAVGVYFANVKDAFGNLAITKQPAGNAAEDEAAAGRTFAFAIDARDGQGTPLAGAFEAALEGPDGTASPQTVVFANGLARVELPAPATLTIEDLPAQTAYTVSEQSLAAEGYSTEAVGAEGTVTANETAVASFTNRKEYVPAAIEFAGTEVLRGRNEAAGEFAFQLYEADGTTPVLDANGNPVTTVNRAASAGVATGFTLRGLQASEPGTYTYVVREHAPDGTEPLPGVAYDERAYEATVTVAQDARGQLSVSSISFRVDGQPVPGIAFVNQYRTSSGAFSLVAHKSITGTELEAGAFAFTAQEIDPDTEAPVGREIVARNDADGTVSFPSIDASVPLGDEVRRSFLVSESIPGNATADTGFSAGGVTYDTVRHRVDVMGADTDGTGALTFAISEEPTFRNSYDDEAAVVSGLTVQKVLAGRDWQEGDSFTFALRAANAVDADGKPLASGAPLPPSSTISIGAFDAAAQNAVTAGSAVEKTFGDIAFTEPGTYEYSLFEQAADAGGNAASGLDYSSALYTLTVDVTSDGQGHLVASPTLAAVTDDAGEPAEDASGCGLTARFGNTYSNSAFASFDGAVEYTDKSGTRPLENDLFTFSIKAVGDNAESAPRPKLSEAGNAGGLFTFGSAEIEHDDDLAGQTFYYEVRQTIPEGARYSEDGSTATLDGMTYDARVQTITVHVVQEEGADGGHRMAVVVEYPAGEDALQNRVVFHNSYMQPDPGPEPGPEPSPDPDHPAEDGEGGGNAPDGADGGTAASEPLAPLGDPCDRRSAALAAIALGSLVVTALAALVANTRGIAPAKPARRPRL